MYLITLFTFLFTLLSLTSASPSPSPLSTTTYSNTSAPKGEYYLKTQVLDSGPSDKDGLYVSGYHTGAGLNDVTLEGIDIASKGFFNNSHQQFDYGTPFPWGFELGGDTNYAAWEFVSLNTGYGSSDLFFNETGLQWNQTYDGFGGWLACDWWHGVPQLFYKNIYYETGVPNIPCSCANVNLLPVPV